MIGNFTFGDHNQVVTGDGNQRFGSSHTAGINAVMCDGSVRVFRYEMDVTIFHIFGQRNDGQILPES